MNNLRGIKQIGRIENTRRRSIHAKNNIKDRGQSPQTKSGNFKLYIITNCMNNNNNNDNRDSLFSFFSLSVCLTKSRSNCPQYMSIRLLLSFETTPQFEESQY